MHEIFIPLFFSPVSLSCADSGCDHIWIFVYVQAVLIPDVVDVEAPEYSATGLVVLLYLERDPRCSRCFRGVLPVHVRYHRPAGDGEEALVALKSPEVLVCCCDGEIEALCVLFLGREEELWVVKNLDLYLFSGGGISSTWEEIPHEPHT